MTSMSGTPYSKVIVKFACGHSTVWGRNPELPPAMRAKPGPPIIGWGEWCPTCKDFQTLIDFVEA